MDEIKFECMVRTTSGSAYTRVPHHKQTIPLHNISTAQVSLHMIPQFSELKGQRTCFNMIITNVLVQYRLRSHTLLLCLKCFCLRLPNAWAEENSFGLRFDESDRSE